MHPAPIRWQYKLGALPLSLQGPNINMATMHLTRHPKDVATGTPGPAPVSDYGTELTFVRMMKDQSNAYTSRISAAYAAQATLSSMYVSSATHIRPVKNCCPVNWWRIKYTCLYC